MSFPVVLAEAAQGGNVLTQTAEQFGVVGWLFISQCFSFAIVCLVLYKFAYQRVLNVLELRRQTIEQGLADAAKSKTELAASEKRSAELLQRSSIEAQKMIDEARAAAKTFQEKQTQQAIAEAEQIIVKAREGIELDRLRMLAELKREVARLVVDTTAKVTGKVLTADDQHRLSADASREIAA
jgi:F-type H+-transporting ATPase subunit b